MNLEEQVCSLSCGIDIKEYISWDEKTMWVHKVSPAGNTVEREGWFAFESGDNLYPAFTSDELMQMLPDSITNSDITYVLVVIKSSFTYAAYYYNQAMDKYLYPVSRQVKLSDTLCRLLQSGLFAGYIRSHEVSTRLTPQIA